MCPPSDEAQLEMYEEMMRQEKESIARGETHWQEGSDQQEEGKDDDQR